MIKAWRSEIGSKYNREKKERKKAEVNVKPLSWFYDHFGAVNQYQ